MRDRDSATASPYTFSLSDAAHEPPDDFESTVRDRAAHIGACHPEVGATLTFEGRVRNHHNGRTVAGLSYSAYELLADTEGATILSEAIEQFDLQFAHVIHRTGELQVGDLAVWIYVGAAHRAASFDGCRYVIEEIKRRLPVWKHESYDDGTSVWVNGAG